MNITSDVKYIGVDDTTIDLFESQYPVPQGISYNSYVILDEKIAVMDTVDARRMEEWEEKLMAALNGRKVDYLVIHHLEPDHAGSIGRLVELFPNMVLIGNAKTFQMLPQFFDFSLKGRTMTVQEGESLCLGTHTLTFLMAPMVHWPEVMVTHDNKDKILFSADAFGTFGVLGNHDTVEAIGTAEERSAEEANDTVESGKNRDWADEAARYYFNIVGKYGGPVQALLRKIDGLDLAFICSLHGPVLHDNLEYYLGLYNMWSSYRPECEGVLIAYASIYGNTRKVAEKAAELLQKQGVRAVLRDLAREDMSETISLAFRFDRMIVAAASYEGGVFSCMQDFLLHLKNKSYQKRRVAMIENGSWAPSAVRAMKCLLETMKDIEVLEPIVTIRAAMKEEDMEEVEKLVLNLSGSGDGR